jgi:hypothetical protein
MVDELIAETGDEATGPLLALRKAKSLELSLQDTSGIWH